MKKPNTFMIFRGGVRTPCPPLDSHKCALHFARDEVQTQTDSLGLIQANLLAFLLRRVLQYDARIFYVSSFGAAYFIS